MPKMSVNTLAKLLVCFLIPLGPSLTLAKETLDQNIEPLRLGQRIKDIRGKLGITLEEASQRTGLARSTLSKIENEQISPTFQDRMFTPSCHSRETLLQ